MEDADVEGRSVAERRPHPGECPCAHEWPKEQARNRPIEGRDRTIRNAIAEAWRRALIRTMPWVQTAQTYRPQRQ